MPLIAPPNNSNSYLALAIGAGFAIIIFTLRSNQLPHVGDNIHSLPHGGFYRDGTKVIQYNSPVRTPNNWFKGPNNIQALALVLLVIGLIHASSVKISRGCSCSK
ncbi:TGB2 [Alfalfa latent virus]|uniref:Movement protein TGB2 n=1 Tax=Alfalfa latent virus TaxID=165250 RepID=Q913Z7_9VIRU|nr:TGB2 [Alfalfa latent virus]AAK85158.1 TBG2 [Alfalfa latent virus]AJP16555.1 TGB2 [Alfalfa latent virus]UZP17291.1 Triple gene block 2 Protein [Pea streak virus]